MMTATQARCVELQRMSERQYAHARSLTITAYWAMDDDEKQYAIAVQRTAALLASQARAILTDD